MRPGTGVTYSLAFHTWADGQMRQMSWSADRMLERLLADKSVAAVVVSDPWRSHMARLRRRAVSRSDGFPSSASRRLVHPYRLRRHDSRDLATSAADYRRLDRYLGDQAARSRTDNLLVTSHPVHAAVADLERWGDVVYYGWDDWLSFPPHSEIRDLMAWSYREIARRDVNVIAVSAGLAERIGARRSTVVPNAMSARDLEGLPPAPEWFRLLSGPVALYAGALEERVDADQIERTARELPGWTFVLVGFVQQPALFARLQLQRNVILPGMVPRPQVLAMMQSATVCLVPHRETEMSLTMSPLKLYEYLASGSPVVATDLPPMRDVSKRCLLVPVGATMTPWIEQAARLPAQSPTELRAWRAEHDWDRRYIAWRQACLPVEPSGLHELEVGG